MSFSSQIKEKLCKSEYGCMNCAAYELSGALQSNSISAISGVQAYA